MLANPACIVEAYEIAVREAGQRGETLRLREISIVTKIDNKTGEFGVLRVPLPELVEHVVGKVLSTDRRVLAYVAMMRAHYDGRDGIAESMHTISSVIFGKTRSLMPRVRKASPPAPRSSTVARQPSSRAKHPDTDARPKPRPPQQPETPVASTGKPVASSRTSVSGRTSTKRARESDDEDERPASKRSSDWWIERAARASTGNALLCQGRCKPDDWLNAYDCYYLGVANCADERKVRPRARRC